jgi:thiol-disulfide isomerase/thioredoxin
MGSAKQSISSCWTDSPGTLAISMMPASDPPLSWSLRSRTVFEAVLRGGVLLWTAILMLSLTSGAFASQLSPPVFRGMSSQFTLLRPVDPVPNTAIRALDGTTTDLSRFRGKVVVLNFWASWCLPCAYEMPSLDRLAAETDPDRLAVIAVSIDQDGTRAVAPFVAAHHVAHVLVLLDPAQRLGSTNTGRGATGALPLWSLPMTYILDKDGGVVGYLSGAAQWDSPEALRFLRYFLDQPDR